MLNLLVILGGGVVGFVLSRLVRTVGRPRPAAAPRSAGSGGPVPSPAVPAAQTAAAAAPAVKINPQPARSTPDPQRAAQVASVARSVSGAVGRRRGLSAPELQRACFSEMVRHVGVDRQGRTHAPASYMLSLHPDDLATVDEARRWFTDGLADALRQAARDHGWVLDGTVQIDLRADSSRRPGAPDALAVPPDAPSGARTHQAPPPAGGTRTLFVVRTDTGERIALGTEVVTIGRSRDRTITIDDNRVSRSHARIEPRQGQWAVIDEGSANGTWLRDKELTAGRPTVLRPGDVLKAGPVELHVTSGTTAPTTRALDDSDRTRISAEVLPPREHR